MVMNRRTRSRIFWYILSASFGIFFGFLYLSTSDIHTRIFTVAAVAALLGFLRPSRGVITGLTMLASGILIVLIAGMVRSQSAMTPGVFSGLLTFALSTAGGLAVGAIGRNVFTSPARR